MSQTMTTEDAADYMALLNELLEERRLRVEAQTERDAYRETLREYSNLGNWDVRRTAKGDLVADVWIGEHADGYQLATNVLMKYAPTASEQRG